MISMMSEVLEKSKWILFSFLRSIFLFLVKFLVPSLDYIWILSQIFSAILVMFWKWNCRWDVDINIDCCSEAVKIIFSTMHSTICEIGEKSVKRQGRNVKDKVIKIVRYFLIFSAYIFLLIKIVRYFLLSLYFLISKVRTWCFYCFHIYLFKSLK